MECECHGVEMWFHVDRRRKAGGYWRCKVREGERNQRRYWADPLAERRRVDDYRRRTRIARMEAQLREMS